MTDPYVLARDAADELARRTGVGNHDALVVLGSGWARAAESLGEAVTELLVTELPGFHSPVAPGHPGQVLSCRVGTRRVLVVTGRTHLFEGHGPAAVAHAVRTAAAAGATLAVLTNASGSLRPEWPLGTGVLVADSLNLSRRTPLVGPRFVDLTDMWSARLRSLARDAEPDLVEGVYAMLPGPEYQTGAETAMLRTLGADLVGMSTVLEALAARDAGLEVLGLSVVAGVEGSGDPWILTTWSPPPRRRRAGWRGWSAACC